MAFLQGYRILIVAKEVFQGEVPVKRHSESGSFDGHFLGSSGLGKAKGYASEYRHIFRGVVFTDSG